MRSRARAGNKSIKADDRTSRAICRRMVAGDALRLRAALENLADNAVKFTQRRRVVFSAGAEPAARGRLRLSSRSPIAASA